MERQDLAVATISRMPWGRRVRWQPIEWRHFVHTGVRRDGGVLGAESALRTAVENNTAAVRWNAETETIERARGRLVVNTRTRRR